jgi:thymidylate synthase (FAD)
MNMMQVGGGTVVLLSGGGKVYTDVAARFTRSEKSLGDIIASPYNAQLVRSIVEKGHLAATEFDYFLFGVEGYSRVTEVQLVRKRMANYLIKSGRVDKHGKRGFDVVMPEGILSHSAPCTLPDGSKVTLNAENLLSMLEEWYDAGVEDGYKEEELRYLKPQATEFKALIGMNAHALLDWFKIRCCRNAQTEIRDLAWKMLRLCKEASPALFEDAGPSCVQLGYCPENDFQNPLCHVIKKKDAMVLLKNAVEETDITEKEAR